MIQDNNKLKNYVTDLKSVYKPRNASPIWESTAFENISLSLPKHEGLERVFRSKELAISSEIKEIEDLKYLVQYFHKNEEIDLALIKIDVSRDILPFFTIASATAPEPPPPVITTAGILV